MVGSLPKPCGGLDIVLRHTLALGIHHAELGLRWSIPLVASLPQPCGGLDIVLRHALAAKVHHAELGLRWSIPLVASLPQPCGGLGIVLRHALAAKVHHAELDAGAPLIGVAPPRSVKAAAALAVLGFGNNALPFTLIAWGQTHLASGLASILNAATPLFSVLAASQVGFAGGPDGAPMVMVVPTWCGPPEEGEARVSVYPETVRPLAACALGHLQRLSVNQMAEFVLKDAGQADAGNVERRLWGRAAPSFTWLRPLRSLCSSEE